MEVSRQAQGFSTHYGHVVGTLAHLNTERPDFNRATLDPNQLAGVKKKNRTLAVDLKTNFVDLICSVIGSTDGLKTPWDSSHSTTAVYADDAPEMRRKTRKIRRAIELSGTHIRTSRGSLWRAPRCRRVGAVHSITTGPKEKSDLGPPLRLSLCERIQPCFVQGGQPYRDARDNDHIHAGARLAL